MKLLTILLNILAAAPSLLFAQIEVGQTADGRLEITITQPIEFTVDEEGLQQVEFFLDIDDAYSVPQAYICDIGLFNFDFSIELDGSPLTLADSGFVVGSGSAPPGTTGGSDTRDLKIDTDIPVPMDISVGQILRITPGTITSSKSIPLPDNLSSATTSFMKGESGASTFHTSSRSTPASISWWTGATDLGGGWRQSPWFGLFYDYPASTWIYHNEHSWMAVIAASPASVYLYTLDQNWLWTSSTTHPYFYRFDTSHWLYYYGVSGALRWFYNFNTGQWESFAKAS